MSCRNRYIKSNTISIFIFSILLVWKRVWSNYHRYVTLQIPFFFSLSCQYKNCFSLFFFFCFYSLNCEKLAQQNGTLYVQLLSYSCRYDCSLQEHSSNNLQSNGRNEHNERSETFNMLLFLLLLLLLNLLFKKKMHCNEPEQNRD